MPLRVSSPVNTFQVNTEVESYPIVTGISVKRGDMLRFIDIDDQTYITNVIEGDDTVDAIAIHTGASTNELIISIPCYVLTYRAKYRDLINYPYIILEQFTYGEIRRTLISAKLSKSCNAISRNTCSLLSRYTCNNLNTYGVREYPL